MKTSITDIIDSLSNLKKNKQIQKFTLTYDSEEAHVDVKISSIVSVDEIAVEDIPSNHAKYIYDVFKICYQQHIFEINDKSTRDMIISRMINLFSYDYKCRKTTIEDILIEDQYDPQFPNDVAFKINYKAPYEHWMQHVIVLD